MKTYMITLSKIKREKSLVGRMPVRERKGSAGNCYIQQLPKANDLEVVERVYVVGTLGGTVPENNSFSVIPTFVVRQAWPVHKMKK